jgi:hypothetical protein
MQGGNRIRQFAKALKNGGYRIDEYWTGGGGNEDVQCVAMCQEVLQRMEEGIEDDLSLTWAVEELRL